MADVTPTPEPAPASEVSPSAGSQLSPESTKEPATPDPTTFSSLETPSAEPSEQTAEDPQYTPEYKIRVGGPMTETL